MGKYVRKIRDNINKVSYGAMQKLQVDQKMPPKARKARKAQKAQKAQKILQECQEGKQSIRNLAMNELIHWMIKWQLVKGGGNIMKVSHGGQPSGPDGGGTQTNAERAAERRHVPAWIR